MPCVSCVQIAQRLYSRSSDTWTDHEAPLKRWLRRACSRIFLTWGKLLPQSRKRRVLVAETFLLRLWAMVKKKHPSQEWQKNRMVIEVFIMNPPFFPPSSYEALNHPNQPSHVKITTIPSSIPRSTAVYSNSWKNSKYSSPSRLVPYLNISHLSNPSHPPQAAQRHFHLFSSGRPPSKRPAAVGMNASNASAAVPTRHQRTRPRWRANDEGDLGGMGREILAYGNLLQLLNEKLQDVRWFVGTACCFSHAWKIKCTLNRCSDSAMWKWRWYSCFQEGGFYLNHI